MAAEFVGGDETVTKIEALIARDSVESAERIAEMNPVDVIRELNRQHLLRLLLELTEEE